MLDGMTMYLASGDKNKPKAAKRAHDVAYWEEKGKKIESSLWKNTSANLQKYSKTDNNTPVIKTPSFYNSPNLPDDVAEWIEKTQNKTPDAQLLTTLETSSEQKDDSLVYYGDIHDGEEHTDLNCGKMTKEQLTSGKWINWHDFWKSEFELLNDWKSLADLTSMGKMGDVLNEMIDHFADGTGTDYSNETLTQVVSEHENTKAFMNNFTKVFDDYLRAYNGNIKEFANSKYFKDSLKNNGVVLSHYSLDGIGDLFGGAYMAIHGWTEREVNVDSIDIKPDGTYSGNLKFTFKDNFGLDAIDIEKFGWLEGFKGWYILQHYDKYKGKYKPFKTVVTIDYPMSGKI